MNLNSIFVIFFTVIFTFSHNNCLKSQEVRDLPISEFEIENGVNPLQVKQTADLENLSEPPIPKPSSWENFKKLFKDNPNRPLVVEYTEITKWVPMGNRYVAGYNNEGEILMVGDLSYPNIFTGKNFSKSLLGTIGIGNSNLGSFISGVSTLLEKKREKSMRKNITKFMDENTPSWKFSAETKDVPEKFSMADLDITSLAPDAFEQFNKLMSELGLESKFLENIQFERNPAGGVDVYFLKTEESDLPPKVIDFRAYKSSYAQAGKILTAMTALKTSVGAIPAYLTFGVKNIFSALIDRWIWLFETQRLNHFFQTLQLLDDAYHGDMASPFYQLSQENLEKAMRYVYNANTMWSNLLPKLFLGRAEPWLKKEALYKEKISTTKEWLKDNDIKFKELHPYFVQSLDESSEPEKIFVLPHTLLFRSKPMTAIDYKNPSKEITRRLLKEVVQQGTNYLDLVIPVPVVPSCIQILDNAFINDEVVRRKNWEARLSAWMLNQQELNKNHQYEKELELLYYRRLNPFELSRHDEELLIRERRKFLGL